MTIASCLFSKAIAISHLAVEDTIYLTIIHKLCIGPLSFGTALDKSLIKLLKKKYPPTLLLAFGSTRQAPSLCTHNTMSEVVYIIVPLGKVKRQSRHRCRALLVSSVALVCWDDKEDSDTRGIGSVALQQYSKVPTISCIRFISLGGSFFNGG